MRSSLAILCGVLTLGCGDSGGASTEAASSTDATSSTSTSTATSSSGGPEGTTGDMVTTGESTSTGETPTTTQTSTSSSSGDAESSGGSSTTDEDTTGGALDCEALVDGPFTAELFVSGFAGSEDLAFDGKGGLALKRDGELVVVRADKSETVVAIDLPSSYGTRYLADGRVVVALPQGGKVVAIDPQGVSTNFVGGLAGPNGVFPDLDGAVWITEFGGSRVFRIGADKNETTIVAGPDASSANGIVYDPERGLVFYTNYQSGQIRRVAIDGQGQPGAAVMVAAIDGASPDGLTLDACGNLYVVDQGSGTLYRVRLDEAGEATGEPSELVVLPSNVANAQFGVGEGFDARTLYLAGTPGDVYMVAVGVPGAPTVTVQ